MFKDFLASNHLKFYHTGINNFINQCVVYYPKEEWWTIMKRPNTSLQKYKFLFEGSAIGVSVRESGRRSQREDSDEDCYIDPKLLNPRCAPIFKALPLCFLDERYLSGGRLWAADPTSAPAGHLLALSGPWSDTVRIWCGYPCIYNFVMPTPSSGWKPTLAVSACLPRERSLIDSSVKDQYATNGRNG